MEMIRVLSTLLLSDDSLNQLRAVSPRLEVSQKICGDADAVTAALDPAVEVLFTFHGPSRLEGAPRLGWVQLISAGADHLMDTPVWKSGITVTTSSGIHAPNVAEYALASMLAFGHRIPQILENQKRREWPEDRYARLGGHELRGQTACIVGYGSIGREVARLCKGLGMMVLAVKRDPDQRGDTGFNLPGMGDPDGTIPESYFSPSQIRDALAQSDYVVVAVPATPATRQLIGEAELRAMPPHAYLVNVARGSVIDQEALVQSLREGSIGGAGLDVFDPEPLPPEHPLWSLERAILSPHVSGYSPHLLARATDLFAANLRRYLAGEALCNQVDRERCY
jgi:phosphoglycerate dehydrogenase-like enzyme